MNWSEIKKSIREDLLSRNLADPNIRLNALDTVEIILRNNMPQYIQNPIEEFGRIERDEFKEKLAIYKDNSTLNGAEESIINEIYYRI